jgi:hypothetical protein
MPCVHHILRVDPAVAAAARQRGSRSMLGLCSIKPMQTDWIAANSWV